MPGLVEEWTWDQKQGDGVDFTATYLEDDGTTPIDLTGYTPELSISKERGKAFLQRWTSAPQIEITDPTNGVVTIHMTPEETRAWGKNTSLVYEITVTPADGQAITILEGPINVRLEVGNE